MRFEWDRHNLKKIKAHGLTQEQVEQVLRGKHYAVGERIMPTGEKRWIKVAHPGLTVVYTKRKGRIRVITGFLSRKVRKILEQAE
jgi:uncharacterized DUF497 family protein